MKIKIAILGGCVFVAAIAARISDEIIQVAPDIGIFAASNAITLSGMIPRQEAPSLSPSQMDWAPELKARFAVILDSGKADDLYLWRSDLVNYAKKIGCGSAFVDRIRSANYGHTLSRNFQNARLVSDFYVMFDSEDSTEKLRDGLDELGRKYPMARQHLALCDERLVDRGDRIQKGAVDLSVELGGAPEDYLDTARRHWASYRRSLPKE